jgi:hypothetical protein
MSDENQISILVCKDAGSASRTLLSREDLRMRWALTAEEARSVIRWTKCAVCITRAQLAQPVVEACRAADREIASVVLLEPERWASWRDYFDLGATAVLQATAADQLLDAMSDATGVSLRTAARIPFDTEVRVTNSSGVWRTYDISTSGMSLLDFPYELGSELELTFMLDGREYTCNANVSRIFRSSDSLLAVGVAFQSTSLAFQEHLEDFISRSHSDATQLIEPDEDFVALDDETVLSLRSATIENNSSELSRALAADGKIAASDRTASWLTDACLELSPLEVTAVRNPKAAPVWAHDAVLARVRVHQIRSRVNGTPTDAEVREVFGLCVRLADSSADADEASLVQVTNIRADILRTLYRQ